MFALSDAHKGKGCNGIMAYAADKKKDWSKCSREDFVKRYDKAKSDFGGTHCSKQDQGVEACLMSGESRITYIQYLIRIQVYCEHDNCRCR